MPPRRPTGKWHFVITILSGGILAAVPFFHAASELRRPALRKLGAMYGAGSLLGYVDLNAAPAQAIADLCQISAPAAATLVETREQLGGFTTVDEAIVYANLDEDAAIGIRERGIIISSPRS